MLDGIAATEGRGSCHGLAEGIDVYPAAVGQDACAVLIPQNACSAKGGGTVLLWMAHSAPGLNADRWSLRV